MIDPLLSLSFSMQSNRGVYALLIGSGVSRAAQIPTGWEVLEDLINQIAILEDEDTNGDPTAWYTKKYGEKPDYSKVLEAVVKSPAERSQLLRKYFEPTDEQRERDEKTPTAAHNAIAKLVADGYVRVIVTTNFDRLLEAALEKQGISPVVISSPDSIKGAPPLTHSKCTIIKLHGDYLDTRIRNTAGELSSYDKETNKLLDQIFDEYGLIISGWSGDWDTALRSAMERCKNHRFTTYWTSRSNLSKTANDLAVLRKAQIITIKSADEFFMDLAQKLEALDEYGQPHPLSVKTAVVMLKKNLSEDRYHIQLHDQVNREIERTHEVISGADFSTQPAIVNEKVIDVARERLKHYEVNTEILLALMTNLAYFGKATQVLYLTRALNRLGNYRDEAGYELLNNVKRYPSLLLEYAAGMAAIAGNNYQGVKAVFDAEVKKHSGEDEPLIYSAHNQFISAPAAYSLTGQEKAYFPWSEYLFDILREPLKDLTPDDESYSAAFDMFEMLIAMYAVHCLLKAGKTNFWVPLGRFGWKARNNFTSSPLDDLGKQLDKEGSSWAPIKTGIFSDLESAKAAYEKVKDYVKERPWH